MHWPVQSLVNTLYFQILILIFIKSIYRQIVLCVNAWKFIFHICLSKGIIPLFRICLFPPWTRSCSGFFPQRFLRHGARDAHSVPGIYSGRLWNCQCAWMGNTGCSCFCMVRRKLCWNWKLSEAGVFLFSLSLTARGRGQKLTILEIFKNFYALVMKKTVKRQISTHAYCSAVLEKIFSIRA